VAAGLDLLSGPPDLNKTFDVALHLGTFIAALVYFWRQIVVILRAWAHSLRSRRIETADERLAWLLLISTIPPAWWASPSRASSRTSSASPI